MQWLQQKQLESSGAPFFRYLIMDMVENRFVVDVGWPLAAATEGDGQIVVDTMPAGRYDVTLNTGSFSDLVGAHYALLQWGEAQGIHWQTAEEGKA